MNYTPKVKTCRVDKLRDGDVVVGTGPSGPFADGPKLLSSRTVALEHSQRTTAFTCEWAGGGRNVYYGDTEMLVQR